MPKGLPQNLGTWMAQVERKLDNLSSGNRLDHASLDGTTLYLKGDGELGRIGRQPDGSNGVYIAKVQPPPQLTAAILTVGEQAGTCLVEWDGGTFDGRRMPLIHGHTEVWAELVGEDWSPTVAPGDAGKRVGTIRDRTGGEVVVALPQAGIWAVWLRAMGADRETAGPWSPVATVEIKPLVDTEAIEAELEDARDRIEQAEQDLAAGMADRKAEIEHLREVRIPALQDALTTGLDDVYREAQQYAEAQADNAVNQAAANAQSEYDRLQEIAERALSRAGDNVLEDPSFETDYWFDQWPSSWFPASPSSEARTGGQSAAVVRASNTTATNMTLAAVDVEQDDSWRFSVWYKTPDEANLGYGTGTALRIRDASTNTNLAQSTGFMVTDEWSRAVVTATIPEGVDQITVAFLFAHTEGTLLLDDMSAQEVGAAAEALRLAEVARQEAEAAHIAAGNAVDTAANAYDAASSKSTVHWSLSAPSGTADSTDDVWWQYELRNGRRVVTGQWFWDSGVWRETEIAEEWLPLVNIGTGTYGDLSGDRLEANTVKAGALAVMPDTVDFAPDPSEHEELWDLHGATLITGGVVSDNPSGLRFSFGRGTGNTQIRGPLRPVTQGQTIYFKGRYGWTYRSSSSVHIRMEWYATPERTISNRLSYDAFVTIPAGSDAGLYEGTVTVPDGAAYANLYMYQVSGSGGNDAINGTIHCEPQVPGVLIQDGAVNSAKVNTEEFFAATAVIEAIWTEIVRSRLIQSEGIITEDMIATGAITTPKLTVTEEMVAEVVKVMRLEGDQMDFNVIRGMIIEAAMIQGSIFLATDADGNETVRLDGMDNFLRGSLHAGVTDGSEVHLDYGIKSRRSGDLDEGESEGTYTYETPYVELRTSNHDYPNDAYPSIQVDGPDAPVSPGQMVISPGYPAGTPPYRGRLNVGGDVVANQFRARNSISSNEGFWINTGSSNQPGGIMRAIGEPRTRIRGRLPAFAAGDEMIAHGSTSSYVINNYTRGSVTFTPTPTGTRRPQVSAHVASNNQGYNDWRTADVASASQTSSGFSWVIRAHPDNGGAVEVWIYWTALWV